jgi:tetratricopeptide (TPR) repeat protein
MAASAAARSRKPQPNLESEDAIALRAAALGAWAKQNVRLIVAVTVVVAVVVVGVMWWRMEQARVEARAAEEFLTLQQQATAAGEVPVEATQTFIQRRDGTAEANEARLLLAQHQIDAGQPEQAVTLAREVARGRTPLAFSGAMLQGAAEDAAGQHEAAISTYLSAADAARLDAQRYEALHAAALLQEQTGNHAAAAETYRRMLETVEAGGIEEAILRMRAAEAEARAAVPAN